MRRLAIAGVLGLAIASAVLIALGTGTPARTQAPPAPPVESAGPAAPDSTRAPATPAPAPEPIIARPTQNPAPEPAAEGAALPAAPDEPLAEPVPWASVRPLPRGWPALTARIAQMQAQSLPCRDHLPRGRLRGRSGPGPGPGAELAVLVLHLETLEDAVRIVDAPLERKGESEDAVVACVQEALRGLTVSMPGTRPGSRQKLGYPLR